MAKGAKRELWKLYDNGKCTRKVCPKCGNAIFMAEHKDRFTCGKCSYTEMKK
ncbi:MAG: 30S ribosomal protein S27ae [Candidatus Nanoarchaeia archaeon]|nr:30S ribosomal protein S27ae [Candidatus Nanoarchaeia archaeon]NCC71555.1 30S ribosomal protein S27ae [bacterium]